MSRLNRTAIVILAAGNSSRMGQLKQLLPLNGKPLIRLAAETALASACNKVIVVLGSRSAEILPALAGLAIEIIQNARWEEGMGTSIHAGVESAEADTADGIILALADQPGVSAQTLNLLMSTHTATGRPIVASQYAGTVGVPVYFAREFFPHLLALKPEQGCKGLILSNADKSIRLECPEAEADIDTPADYERLTTACRE